MAAKRRKKAEAKSRGLEPQDVVDGAPPARIDELSRQVKDDGGVVLATYKDPLGGNWQLLVALPLEMVKPTPYQRDLSEAHVKNLSMRIDQLGRFLDPVIAYRKGKGDYWTPNGNHRRASLAALGAKTITALLLPDEEIAFKILSLNTEKAHNLREKALEVIRMAESLAQLDPRAEREFAVEFEEPQFLTLGLCYQQNGRFAGSTYQPVLKRLESFHEEKLPRSIELRRKRAAKLIALDEAVSAAVAALKERGFQSPYLKTFVVARVNPIRFSKAKDHDFDDVIDKMIAGAKKFDASKVKSDQLASASGPPDEG